MPILSLYNFGVKGVNVDSSDLHMEDGELRKSQNAITDPKGWQHAIVNRDGLQRFNAVAANGSVLGGICVPLPDERTPPSGIEQLLFLGYQVDESFDNNGTFSISGTTSNIVPTGDWSTDGASYVLGNAESGVLTFDLELDTEISLSGTLSGNYTEGTLPSGFSILTYALAIGDFSVELIGGGSATFEIPALSVDSTVPDGSVSPASITAYALGDALGQTISVTYTIVNADDFCRINPSSIAMYGTWQAY